jgi:integrase
MRVRVRYLKRDYSTGRVEYRRAIPAELRAIIGKREIKQTLGIHIPGDLKSLPADALALYAQINSEAEAQLEAARVRLSRPLLPLDQAMIDALVAQDTHIQLEEDVEGRADTAGEDELFASVAESLDKRAPGATQGEFQSRRFEKRQEGLEGYLATLRDAYAKGDWRLVAFDAADLCQTYSVSAEEGSPEFRRLALALIAGRIGSTQMRLRRQAGEPVPTPPPVEGLVAIGDLSVVPASAPAPTPPRRPAPEPHRPALRSVPAKPALPRMSVSETLAECAKSERVNVPIRQAFATASKYFEGLFGDVAIGEVTKAQAVQFKRTLESLPARPKASERKLTPDKLAALYADRDDVPKLDPKTINKHIENLARAWKWAEAHGYAEGDKNPFDGLRIKSADRAPRSKAITEAYSIDDLSKLFSTPIFSEGARPARGRGEAAYWLPLIGLFTGARLEELAGLLVGDFKRDPKSGRWLLTIGGDELHPEIGQRRTKTGDSRTFPLPMALIRLGLLDHVAQTREAGETRLFPLLRPTGQRKRLAAKWGEWWGAYIKEHGIIVPQPMHGFRHAWNTAARATGVPKEAREWIVGHKGDGSMNDRYGDRSALGPEIDKVRFDGLDLSALEKPGAEERAANYRW